MKKADKKNAIRSEYKKEDLEGGVRGKYYESYQKSHNVVLLKPEVAKVFHTEEAVNEALMSLIKVARSSINLPKDSI